MEQKKRERMAQRAKDASAIAEAAKAEKEQMEWEERARTMDEEENQRQEEWLKYMKRLKPFVGMEMDEPQLMPKYPLQRFQSLLAPI